MKIDAHTSTPPKRRYPVTEKLMSYPRWTTLSQAQNLVISRPSCTISKTMKPWSKMITEGRSPTMRHVSWTHRVTLDMLFDNQFGPTNPNQICWHQKKQLADMLTKRNFTRDEWNHLLQTFNIMDLSMFSCTHFRPIRRTCGGKIKADDELVSRSVNRSPTLDWGVSHSTVNYGMQSQNSDRSGIGESVAQNVQDVNENAASSSQVCHQNEHTRTGIEKSIAQIQNRLTESSTSKTLRIFVANVRQKLSRQEEDQMLALNGIFWRIFVSDTEGSSSSRTRLREKAVYHHEHRLEQLETLFNISQQLILNHGSEICGISTIGWHHTLWRRSTLQHDRAIKLSQAMVHVYSDSVLCLGKMHAYSCTYGKVERTPWILPTPRITKKWCGIDGEPFEFEWHIFPGHTAVELLREIQMRMTTRGIKPAELEDRIIFMSMYNDDIDWSKVEKMLMNVFRTLWRL